MAGIGLNEDIVLEETGINIENEKSLHASIKRWYSVSGDRFEVKVGSNIVDIVRGDLLIEIQTRNFSSISKKIKSLARKHNVLLVHPIPAVKWITLLNENGGMVSRRKSPKKGRVDDIFNELVRTSYLIDEENLKIEVLMTEQEEIRVADGKGSWRRKGISIVDMHLLDVVDRTVLNTKTDFLRFLPYNPGQAFTNKGLAHELGVPVSKARKITYCLKKTGLIMETGKTGNELIFEVVPEMRVSYSVKLD